MRSTCFPAVCIGKQSPVPVGQTRGRWSSGAEGDVCMNGGSWQSVPASGIVAALIGVFCRGCVSSRFRKWHRCCPQTKELFEA